MKDIDGMTVEETRLSALRKREASLRAAIAAETDRLQKRKAKERERLILIVGDALIDEADRSANFKTMMKQILNTAVVDEKSRRLLSTLGWL